MPSTTSLIFSLITLLICPNSSSLFMFNLAGASALYVTNLKTSVNLSCMVLIGFRDLFKRKKTNADKITIKRTAIIACILSSGIVFDVNTSFCIADIASQPRSFSSIKSAYKSSPFKFLYSIRPFSSKSFALYRSINFLVSSGAVFIIFLSGWMMILPSLSATKA
ncbi:hypothetical protein UNSW2_2014 [Campylobacter concisus UNSW2]|uniref:Uncharacterized protein n=1 Tax=Campylobacter concisus UNSW2 TaxID=1242965 RepID=U2EYH8_9BACT|nr:hypothetical protein UNSW2_2014 [Campylobacter concisus UNSW2]